jgi:hypothetical protein
MDFYTSAADLVATIDSAWPLAGVIGWLICLAALSPAVFRLMGARGRYLDPIWAIVFLLAVNRLTFLLQVSRPLSHITALLLALAMAWFSLWYQRHDA